MGGADRARRASAREGVRAGEGAHEAREVRDILRLRRGEEGRLPVLFGQELAKERARGGG